MNKLSRVMLLCVLFLPGPGQAQPAGTLSAEQEALLANGRLHGKEGWRYLHVEGSPRERGFQHGYLLAADIREGVRIQARVWEYESAMEWDWLVRQSADMFTAKIDSENLAEIDGIAEGMAAAGMPMSRDELIAYNGSTESIGYWWPTVKDSLAPNAPPRRKESCSSFIATGSMTADGRIVLGHNTWSTFYYAVSNVIMDILPEHGHRILMQASAGLIHSGTDFFITDAGLVGSETTIDGFLPFDPGGIPEFSRMRRATQYASSIDEWCAIMQKGNNGGYANAWLLGDIGTNEIAWFELGLKYTGFKKTRDGYFSGSNVAEDPKILRVETNLDEMNIKNADIAARRHSLPTMSTRISIGTYPGHAGSAATVNWMISRRESTRRSIPSEHTTEKSWMPPWHSRCPSVPAGDPPAGCRSMPESSSTSTCSTTGCGD
jgi:hypothetical protein